jgi:hypothetical protein
MGSDQFDDGATMPRRAALRCHGPDACGGVSHSEALTLCDCACLPALDVSCDWGSCCGNSEAQLRAVVDCAYLTSDDALLQAGASQMCTCEVSGTSVWAQVMCVGPGCNRCKRSARRLDVPAHHRASCGPARGV